MSFVKSIIIIIIIIIFDYMSKHKDPNQRPNEIRPMYLCCPAFLYQKKNNNNNNKKIKKKGRLVSRKVRSNHGSPSHPQVLTIESGPPKRKHETHTNPQ